MENGTLARVNTTICLRGKKFPAGVIIRVWDIGGRVHIQPLHLPDKMHGVLWYTLPHIHENHIEELRSWECALVDLGFL